MAHPGSESVVWRSFYWQSEVGNQDVVRSKRHLVIPKGRHQWQERSSYSLQNIPQSAHLAPSDTGLVLLWLPLNCSQP